MFYSPFFGTSTNKAGTRNNSQSSVEWELKVLQAKSILTIFWGLTTYVGTTGSQNRSTYVTLDAGEYKSLQYGFHVITFAGLS